MDARLKELYNQGHSCATIGAMMGKTRNAIIGRVHRIDLPRRAQSYRKKSSNLAPKRSKVAAVHILNRPIRVSAAIFANCEPLPPAMEYDKARVSVSAVADDDCRWPVGDPAQAGAHGKIFCGKTKLPRLPYCEVHTRRAYQTPQPRRHVHVGEPDSNVIELKAKQSVPA